MKHTYKPLLLVLLYFFSSCGTHKKIEGLWQIERVQVGDQEMTPNAKWTRFNKDYSQ